MPAGPRIPAENSQRVPARVGAQLVVMDRETGEIEKVLAVHDVGRAVNPMLCERPIQGAVHMGLGYALSEEFPSAPDRLH